MSKPRPCTPDIPLVDTAPSVDEPFRNYALRRKIADVLEGLVDDVHEDLEEGEDVEDAVGGRGFDCMGAPSP